MFRSPLQPVCMTVSRDPGVSGGDASPAGQGGAGGQGIHPEGIQVGRGYPCGLYALPGNGYPQYGGSPCIYWPSHPATPQGIPDAPVMVLAGGMVAGGTEGAT